MLSALGTLGLIEGERAGDAECAMTVDVDDGETPMKQGGREDGSDDEGEEIDVDTDAMDVDVEEDEEEGTGGRTTRGKVRQTAEAQAQALPNLKEEERLEAELTTFRALFPVSALYTLAARTLNLLLACTGAAEAQGVYDSASKTRNHTLKNHRLLMDKLIGEAVTSKSAEATCYKAAIVRAVGDADQIARVVANAVAWRMARRNSDRVDFPTLFHVNQVFVSDGIGQGKVCADLTECMRYVTEDADKLVKTAFGAGGLRVLLSHALLPVLQAIQGDGQALRGAYVTACDTVLGLDTSLEGVQGAVGRAQAELRAARDLVSALTL